MLYAKEEVQGEMGSEESFVKKEELLKKQFEGYTPPHRSRSCDEIHSTWRGSEHTVHVYGEKPDFPWPIGKSPDKWFAKKEEK